MSSAPSSLLPLSLVGDLVRSGVSCLGERVSVSLRKLATLRVTSICLSKSATESPRGPVLSCFSPARCSRERPVIVSFSHSIPLDLSFSPFTTAAISTATDKISHLMKRYTKAKP